MKLRKIRLALAALLLLSACGDHDETADASFNTQETDGAQVNVDDEDVTEAWDDESAAHITLEGESAQSDSSQGITIGAGIINITRGGTYVFTGSYEGRLIINSLDDDTVRIVLNGASFTSSYNAAIENQQAGKLIITSVSGTTNYLTDSANYSLDDEAPSACLYSKDDLVINGGGRLIVTGNYNDAISGRDDVYIISADITVTSVDDGIIGKDLLYVEASDITVKAEGDGLKSSNDTDEGRGIIVIASGNIDITAGDDGIQAITLIDIEDGQISVLTGQGSAAASKHNGGNMFGGDAVPDMGQNSNPFGRGQMSPGGMMPDQPDSNSDITPSDNNQPAGNPSGEGDPLSDTSESASVYLAAAMTDTTAEAKSTDPDNSDDASTQASYHKGITCEGDIVINGGTVIVDAEDDAFNAEGSLTVAGGDLRISSGDDGMHADDTLAVSGGTILIEECYEGLEAMYINISGGLIDITASDDGINTSNPNMSASLQSDGSKLSVTGGEITVYAAGDGVDINGSGIITGGTLTVYGPVSSADTALDANGGLTISGGTILAGGSSGMLEYPSVTGDARMISITAGSSGTLTITDSKNEEVASYTSDKTYANLLFISTVLEEGETYTVTLNNEVIGTVTVNASVSYVNGSGASGFGGMMPGGRPGR